VFPESDPSTGLVRDLHIERDRLLYLGEGLQYRIVMRYWLVWTAEEKAMTPLKNKAITTKDTKSHEGNPTAEPGDNARCVR
jgi:hypothetical protein